MTTNPKDPIRCVIKVKPDNGHRGNTVAPRWDSWADSQIGMAESVSEDTLTGSYWCVRSLNFSAWQEVGRRYGDSESVAKGRFVGMGFETSPRASATMASDTFPRA